MEKNSEGKRVIDGWKVFYQEWFSNLSDDTLLALTDASIGSDDSNSIKDNEISPNVHQNGTGDDNLFPESRLGYLDANNLKNLEWDDIF